MKFLDVATVSYETMGDHGTELRGGNTETGAVERSFSRAKKTRKRTEENASVARGPVAESE
jgi:hypothetical protein